MKLCHALAPSARLTLCVALGTAVVGAVCPPKQANAAAPVCATPRLVVWLGRGSGAAGSTYYNLEFTNLSGHTCTLRGYPGVSAVTLVGRRIGEAASRANSTTRSVELAEGATASAVLRVVVAENYPVDRCHPTIAAGLRVYPPGDQVSKIVPFAFRACRAPSAPVLSIKPVTSATD